ncbi:DNA-processing protein DprA [Clostridia bacterium OttesenSCG-928-F22]|nr:DNA-processing protein DprA [Clostridia bacterium OttesenSCG-928-F22]
MQLNEQEKYWLWLYSIEGVGLKRFHALLDEFVDVKSIWDNAHKDNTRLNCVGEAVKQRILACRNDDYMEQQLRLVEKAECRVVTMLAPEYPRWLKEIYDPPPVLFVKGGNIDYEKMIAVVGTRHCTRIGRETAKYIGKGLSQSGVSVVSGLARGIDTAAHLGALEGGTPTIAVLGCGVDVIYPPENRACYERIMENGAVVSEYMPQTEPLPVHFPRRNRIISGMSRAVVVVESPNKSGSMLTVEFAQEQGRDVFAVPGSILSKSNEGTNALLRECAYPFTKVEDVLNEYGWNKQILLEQKKFELPEAQNNEERALMELLQSGEHSYEELMEALKLNAQELNTQLSIMEVRGILSRLPGRRYKLNNGI